MFRQHGVWNSPSGQHPKAINRKMDKSEVNLIFSHLKGCVSGQHIQRHEGLKLLLVEVPTRRKDTLRPSVSMVSSRDTFRRTRSRKWTWLSRDLGGTQ